MHGVLETELGLNCVEALDRVFRLLPSCIQSPRYPDRANPERCIDAYVNDIVDSTRRLIDSEARQARALVDQLQVESDTGKAEMIIRRLVGHAAPAQADIVWTVPLHAGRTMQVSKADLAWVEEHFSELVTSMMVGSTSSEESCSSPLRSTLFAESIGCISDSSYARRRYRIRIGSKFIFHT